MSISPPREAVERRLRGSLAGWRDVPRCWSFRVQLCVVEFVHFIVGHARSFLRSVPQTAVVIAVLVSYRGGAEADQVMPRDAVNLAPAEMVVDPAAQRAVADEEASVLLPFPQYSAGVDAYLRIPAVVKRVNAALLRPYQRLQRGVRVVYRKNLFSTAQPDLIWVPEMTSDRFKLRWETYGRKVDNAGLVGVFPGNILRIIDDTLYDFGVGTLFVHVENETSGKRGYTLYETIIGDCDPADDQLWVAENVAGLREQTVFEFQGTDLYQIGRSQDAKAIDAWIEILGDPARYERDLNGGLANVGVHPVYASNVVSSLLVEVLRGRFGEERQVEVLSAVERFMIEWGIPKADSMPRDTISWPYRFPWTTNWGITLEAPWYSAYANARMALSGAMLFNLTGHDRYRVLAQRAAGFLAVPIDEGGAQYDILGFKLPAEYIYPSPPLPNVRVLDGELIAVATLFNVARILGDSRILRLFMTQAGSLAMQLESYQRPDGNLEFAMYIEDLPLHYRWDVWSALQILANATKDRRFSDVALEFAKHIPQEWKDSRGS